jgi:hypothetical protein
LPTLTFLPGGGAACRATMTRTWGNPSSRCSQPERKQLNNFACVLSSHACAGWMSEHALELWPLEHPIRSPPCDQVDSSLVSRWAITTASPYCPSRLALCRLWWESEVRQVGSNSLKRRSQFTLIVAIASIPIRTDPLPGMHLCVL